MSAPAKQLTPVETRVAAAWAALCAARNAAWRSPNADNIENEQECERMLNRCLDRLPREKSC